MDIHERPTFPPGSSPRILIVDRVLPVERFLTTFFDPFEVEIVTSGASALDRLASTPPINAVVCNLVLGDLDGRDLYRQVCARSHELRGRFIFVTDDRFPLQYTVDVSFPMLARPFDPKLLLDILRLLVSRSPRCAEV